MAENGVDSLQQLQAAAAVQTGAGGGVRLVLYRLSQSYSNLVVLALLNTWSFQIGGEMLHKPWPRYIIHFTSMCDPVGLCIWCSTVGNLGDASKYKIFI